MAVTASVVLGLTATSVAAQTDPAGADTIDAEGVPEVPVHPQRTDDQPQSHGVFGSGPAAEETGAIFSGENGVRDKRGTPPYSVSTYILTEGSQDIDVGGVFKKGFGEELRLQTATDEGVTGNVTGKILDGEGNRLPDADVRLMNVSSGTVTRTTSSDDNGDYSFESIEPGRYRIEAESDGKVDSVTATVQAGTTVTREITLREAAFSVSFETNSPVTEGERLFLDAEVTNTGDEPGTQSVTAEVPGLGSGAEIVDLEGGASTTVSFEIPTEGDSGEYTAEVSAEDSAEQKDVIVRDSEIEVSILRTNSPVTEGESIEVEATVSNTGEREENGVVTAGVLGLGQTGDRFSLLGGNEKVKTFTIQTQRGDAGDYTVEVGTEDEDDGSDTADVKVKSGDRNTDRDNLPEIEVTEETGKFVRFTLIDASGLEEAYMTFEPDGWTSSRVFAGLEEGASLTVRTEDSARRLLESKEVRVPSGVSFGLGGLSLDTTEATEVDQVTCLYDHDGFSFRGVPVPAEIDLPCHAPTLRDSPYVDEGTGVPIALQEGEYRFVGIVNGEERELHSHVVESVEQDGNVSEAGTEGTRDTGNEQGSEQGNGGDGQESTTERDGGGPEPFGLQDIGRYLALASAFLIGFAVVVAASILVVRNVRDADWSLNGTEEAAEREQRRLVLDTEAKNEVYDSWRGMIECADIEDVRTKTSSEISEEAKQAGLDPGAVEELSKVFDKVRYSDSEPTAEQEKRAKEALKRVKRSDGRE